MTPFEDIVRKAGAERDALSPLERERMRIMLSEYAAFKPVRAPTQVTGTRLFRIGAHPVFAGALALLLVIVSGGSAAYAAEGSLPGDLLYPVKVDVTEPVVTALTPIGKAQVAWHLAIARRRLGEAAALAKEGRLASSTEVALIGEAADATLKSAALATALPQASTTTSAAETASTTAGLVTASQLILEARSKLEQHDDRGASRAFRASIRTAAKLQVLNQAAGVVNLQEENDATTTPVQTGDDSSTTATSTDQGASVINGVTNVERSGHRWWSESDATQTSTSGVRFFGN